MGHGAEQAALASSRVTVTCMGMGRADAVREAGDAMGEVSIDASH